MSDIWTMTIPKTPKAAFDAAVDAAEAVGQDAAKTPHVAVQVAAAKAALKLLAAQVQRPLVSGYVNGHALEAGEGDEAYETIHPVVRGFAEDKTEA